MKNLLAIAAMLLLTTAMYAQRCDYETPTVPPPFNPNALLKAGNCVSNNGYCHTPKGNLHIMFVYVVFNNEQPDFKLIGTVLKCRDCYISAWELESYGVFGIYADGTPTFGGRDSTDILQGNGMELEIVIYFKDTNTVGLKDFAINHSLSENPVTNNISINFKEPFLGYITILNSLGQVLYTSYIQNQNNHIIDVDHFASGVYYLQISTPEIQSKPIKLLKL